MSITLIDSIPVFHRRYVSFFKKTYFSKYLVFLKEKTMS